MKNLKSVLAVLAALCLLLCLTVPVFATENVTLTTGNTTAATTDATTDATTGTEEDHEGVQGSGAEVEEGDISISLDETTPVVEDEHAGHDHATETEPESTGHKVIRIILTVLEVIASIALIVIVLVQSGKEAGLSSAIAGNNDSYMSKGKGASWDKKLASATKWIALVWIVLTLLLSLI